MSYEEQFDRSIKQKMEEADYPFNENNWEKANRMIDAERKNSAQSKLSNIYLPAMVLGMIAISFIMLMFFKQSAQPETLHNTEPVTTSNPTQEVAPEIVTPVRTLANRVVEAPTKKTKIANATRSAELVNKRSETNTTLMQHVKSVQLLNGVETKNNITNNNHNQNINNEGINNQNAEDNNQNINTKNINNENTLSNEQNPATENILSSKQSPLVEQQSITTAKQQTEGVWAPSTVEAPALTSLQQEETVWLAQADAYTPVEETDIVAAPVVLLPRYDDDYVRNQKNHRPYFMNVEAGANYNFGWIDGQDKDGRGLNWFAGFNYGVYLNQKTAVGIGAQVFNLQHTEKPIYKGITTEYAFYSNTTGTIITSNNLYFASIPVKFYYLPNNFNQFGCGFYTAYLFDAQSTVKTYSQTDESGQLFNADVTTRGVYNNSRRFNYMLSVFYRVRPGRRVALNAEYVYGFTDIFDNGYATTASQKILGFKVSLQYTFSGK